MKGVIWTSSDCWEWTGAHTASGYGQHQRQYVHRLMFERYVGPIPEGLEIDHLCRNRGCCNPLHLEAVTHAENMRRSGPATKTSCKHGHEYTPENTIINTVNGGRMCRECVRDRKRRDYRDKNPIDKSQASRTHCPKQHPLAGDNLYTHKDGRRECRECRRESNRKSAMRAYYRKKAAS